MSGSPGRVTDASWWLRTETPKHLALLTKLREKLEASLEDRPDLDPSGEQRVNSEGNRMVIPADVNENGTPTRAWCRVLQRYQTGWSSVVNAEIQIRKLALLAQRANQGQPPLTDEEYERELSALGREAIADLPDAELELELARRRGQSLAMMAPIDVDPDDR